MRDEKPSVDKLFDEVMKLKVTQFYEFMEKIQEFLMEQQNALKRYVPK